MLSQELRPISLEEMAGQDENKKILNAIIKNPEKAPKCIIFSGAFGTGKTSSARIMARELNNIKDRDYDLLNSQFYYEFDSTVIGNVDTIRQMRDQFLISYGDYYRIIVIDECHAVSTQAQNALLKVLEEAEGKVFFILCTTEINKVLPTIRSRSLELDFKEVPRDDIIHNLEQVAQSRNIPMSNEIMHIIADRSFGHMRNAHMLIDKYLLLGEEEFIKSVPSASKWYYAFFMSMKYDDNVRDVYVTKSINLLMNIPIEDLHSDWNTFIIESLKYYSGLGTTNEHVLNLVKEYTKEQFSVIISMFFSDELKYMFRDMPYFQATMLYIFMKLKAVFNPVYTDEEIKSKSEAQQQINNRRNAHH